MRLNDLISQLPPPTAQKIEVDMTDLLGVVFAYRVPDVCDVYAASADPQAAREWQLHAVRLRGEALDPSVVPLLELMVRLHQAPAFEGELRPLYLQLMTRLPLAQALELVKRFEAAMRPYLPTADAVEEKKEPSKTDTPTT